MLPVYRWQAEGLNESGAGQPVSQINDGSFVVVMTAENRIRLTGWQLFLSFDTLSINLTATVN